MMGMAGLILFALGLQDPAALIEQLRSGDIAARERAVAELEKLGSAAEEHLKKVADDKDVLVANAARRLLHIIEFDRTLSPGMKKAMPRIAARVANDDPKWIREFLDALDARPKAGQERPFPDLRRSDLEPLAVVAAERARAKEDKQDICKAVDKYHFAKAEPGLLRIMSESDSDVALWAARALVELRGSDAMAILVRETSHLPALLPRILDEDQEEALAASEAVIPTLTSLLGNADIDLRRKARDVLSRFRAKGCVPALRELQKHSSFQVRIDAMALLKDLDPGSAATETLKLLQHPDAAVRSTAAYWMEYVELDVPAALRTRFLNDECTDVRSGMLELIARHSMREAIDDVAGLLKHPDAETRRGAIDTLVALGESRCVDRVAALLSDEDGDVRAAALKGAARLDPKRAFEWALGRLEDEEEDVREAALEIMCRFRSRLPVDRLLRVLKDEKRKKESAEMLRAAAALASVDPARARPFLEEQLAGRPYDSFHLVSLLAASADPVSPLISALENYTTCEWAAEWLARLSPGSVIPALRNYVTNPESKGRMWAARLLGILRVEDARGELLKLLENEIGEVRAAALKSLGELGRGPGIERIRAMTRDESRDVRAEAARTLGLTGDREGIPELRRLLHDEENDVISAAAEALWNLRDPELATASLGMVQSGRPYRLGLRLQRGWLGTQNSAKLVPLLQDRDSEARQGAAEALGSLRIRAAARDVLPLVRERATQEAAADALGSMEAAEVVPDLVRLLEAPDPVSRMGALKALASVGGPEAEKAVRGLIDRADVLTKGKAIEALGRIGVKDSIPRLRSLLRDPNPDLRKAAVKSLSDLEAPEACRDFIDLLDDVDESVVQAACQAISDLDAREAIPHLMKRIRVKGRPQFHVIKTLGALQVKEAIPSLMEETKSSEPYDVISALVTMKAPEVMPLVRKTLADRGFADFVAELKARPWDFDWDCLEAARALAELGDTSVLRALLNVPLAHFRLSAAEQLCRLGDAEGVPVLLSQPEPYVGIPYHVLNRLRRPDAWRKLDTRRISPRKMGRRRLVDHIARAAGLEIRWPEATTFDELEFLSHSRGGERWPNLRSMLDSLFRRQFHHGRPEFGTDTAPPFDYVLEDDHIRVLPWRDVKAFWMKWWSEEQAKKK